MGHARKTDGARVEFAPGGPSSGTRIQRAPRSITLVEPQASAANPLLIFRRDSDRALARLTSLLRTSHLLTMQETVDFISAFLDEALPLSSVVVVHDRAQRPLVWSALSGAALDRARAQAEDSYVRMMTAPEADPPDLWDHPASSGSVTQAITRPLAVPLLGVIRFEGEGLSGQEAQAFLRHATILLSLALDRCVDCERPAAERGAPLSAAAPHQVFSSALVVAKMLARTLDGTTGDCRYAADALRVARGMTLNVIDVLELHAEPAR